MSNITLPLTELYAPISDGLHRCAQIMEQELRSDLEFVEQLCQRVQGYRGKMLRPALVLLCAESLGNRGPEHDVVAAVVELVHLATLVHDDVLDEAHVRRRQETVNRVAGNEAAVMLGDYLISHAFHLCSSLESQYASRLIGQTTNVVCEGELMQIHLRGRMDVRQDQYFEIIRRKTAALTAACCELGAHFAGADADTRASLRGYGEQTGMAFQIMDDILDLVGAEHSMGKTLGRDVELGKLTLPMIHCLSEGPRVERQAMLELLSNGAATGRSRIASLCQASGSIEFARNTAQEFVSQALSALQCLPVSAARSSLTAMAEFILQREN